MKSILDKVNILIENYRIVFYYGQLDIICPYRLSEAFFSNIEFRYAYDYYKAERKVWTYERQDDQDNIVGFIKEAHNLVEVLIRNAGHMVPRDQPRFMMDLLRKYIGS
ncbi:vitellogenic carboxypeptidase-like [Diaphorina citri]|nr:vitellogenic carboxypeptidase-like [Diaphorina citri]